MTTAAYDPVASDFDRHRLLPTNVADAIRASILGVVAAPSPRMLDLGAGTGRVGQRFVAAGDDYVGVDLSFRMLWQFMQRPSARGYDRPRLAQADGGALPFATATFDAVVMIQVFGAARNWDRMIAEARRVLRPRGALVLGRTVLPENGLDAAMKRHLASLLVPMSITPFHVTTRDDLQGWLASIACDALHLTAASWTADRTPRAFLERQRTGARFASLPDTVKDEALAKLRAWAVTSFGSLDMAFPERHEFELRVFRFDEGTTGSE